MRAWRSRGRSALRYVRGVSRGARKGAFFPAASRVPRVDAPGGTHRETRARFELVTHRVPIAGLAAPLSILQLTDTHVRGPTRQLAALCAELAALEADLVVLTGDLVAREWTQPGLTLFLSRLPRARLGCYAIPGNWEYWSGVDAARLAELCAPHGIEVLHNRHVQVGGLTLAGVDDALAGDPDVDAALAGVPDGVPVVCLTHSPILFPQIAGRADLVLSGHTHDGQVRLPLLGAVWVPKGSGTWIGGFYHQDRTWLHVGAGLGWSVAPVRVRCPAEVVRLDLVPQEPP